MGRYEKDRVAVLIALTALSGSSYFEEESYFPFAAIMDRTGLDRRAVRNACRVLRRRGLTDFRNGLWTEDGEPAGSGYRITKAGRDALGPKVLEAVRDDA